MKKDWTTGMKSSKLRRRIVRRKQNATLGQTRRTKIVKRKT